MADTLALLILGFKETDNPTPKQISAAFKRVSLFCHPDTGGSIEMFRGLTMAKNLLLESAPIQTKKSESNFSFTQSNQATYNQEEYDHKKLESLNSEIYNNSDMISFHIYSFISKRVDLFKIDYAGNVLAINFKKSGRMDRKNIDFCSSKYSTSQVIDILTAFNATLRYLDNQYNKKAFNKIYTYPGKIENNITVSLTLLPWHKSFRRICNALLYKSYRDLV